MSPADARQIMALSSASAIATPSDPVMESARWATSSRTSSSPNSFPGKFWGLYFAVDCRVGRPALGRLLVYAGKGEQRLKALRRSFSSEPGPVIKFGPFHAAPALLGVALMRCSSTLPAGKGRPLRSRQRRFSTLGIRPCSRHILSCTLQGILLIAMFLFGSRSPFSARSFSWSSQTAGC